MKKGFLRALGVYGYEQAEPVILAALVSGDPLLLIGRAGTGKTFLLNSLSEALGLIHRHYNASLIAFDDLVGFPWPHSDGQGIRYLETPATVWQAQSVLVDEINRCKPEHQNRLFSLVHEKKVQGIRLEKLRYRWAAMNPAGFGQDGEDYAGCEPLDAALADRFSFVIEVSDWPEIGEDDRRLIADPRGDGKIAKDGVGLVDFIQETKLRFSEMLNQPPEMLLEYALRAGTALGEAGIRISPRRVRQLSKNLLALVTSCDLPREELFRIGLKWSIPQRASLTKVDESVIHAAHRVAWECACADGEDRWLHEFHWRKGIDEKAAFLLEHSQCPDTGTVAVAQFLASATKADAVAFALALYPGLCDRPRGKVGEEGVQDLGKVAHPVFEFDKTLIWRDGSCVPYLPAGGGKHEARHRNFPAVEGLLGKLKGQRKKRARQLLFYLLSNNWLPVNVEELEEQFHRCILTARKHHAT
jgi:MoxR-like ATPase